MIRYDEFRRRATQDLGYISTYKFEGEFTKVIAEIQKEYEYYSEYLTKPHEIRETNYTGGAYLDKTSKKSVQFDKIYIDCIDTDDNGKEFRIKGERNLTAEEDAALNAKQLEWTAKREVEEKEQLRKLQEKYPNG